MPRHDPEERNTIILYTCFVHGAVHYWNETHGWINEKLEATEFTWAEAQKKEREFEKILSTKCRSDLHSIDRCEGQIGLEALYDGPPDHGL